MPAISSAIFAISNRMRWLSSVTLSDMFLSGLTSLENLIVKSANITIMRKIPIPSIISSLLSWVSLFWFQAIYPHLLDRTLYSSSSALYREDNLPTLCIYRWFFLNLLDRVPDLQLSSAARTHLLSVIQRLINYSRSPYATICTYNHRLSTINHYILQKTHNILINQTWLQNCQAGYQGVVCIKRGKYIMDFAV